MVGRTTAASGAASGCRAAPGGGTRRSKGLRAGLAAATALSMALVAGVLSPSQASASDTLPWPGDAAPNVNQPYQHGYSPAGLLNWDPATDPYAPQLRARVPLQKRIAADAATQQNPELPAATQMLNLAGDYGNSFFESQQDNNEFSQYLFNYWQYTDYYASWHGTPTAGIPTSWYDPDKDWTQKWFEFGMLNLPNPAYTNAGHANGVKSLGCIFFSDNDRGEQSFQDLLVKDADGTFPAATKLAQLAKYFGFDGYFINQEQASVTMTKTQMSDYKKFIAQLRSDGMYVQWYDSVDSNTGALSYKNEFNAANSPFVKDAEQGNVANSIFLNYWWNKTKLVDSQKHATDLGLDPLAAVFAGVEAGKDQFEQTYNLDSDLDEKGRPRVGIATLGADFVSADMDNKTDDKAQSQVFDRERRWWTGSSTGTGDAEGSWKGIANYIAERSVIGGSTFSTTFNTGHGLQWRDKGRVSNDGEWSNMNAQQPLPTWQWRIDADTTPLAADFDYGPGYQKASRLGYKPVGGYDGGDSLVLSGDLAAKNTVRLFKTDLSVRKGSRVELTWNKPASDGSRLSVAAVLASDPSTVVELPLESSGKRTGGWRTASVDLSRLAGQHIATLGLVVDPGKGKVPGYQVNVGSLRVLDGASHIPARPTGLRVDRAYQSSDEAVVSWNMAPYSQVRRYELYFNGRHLGTRYDQTMYIKHLGGSSGTLELRAVGPDGSVSAAATTRIDLRKAARDVTTSTAPDGTMKVSWANTSRLNTPTTLSVRTLDSLSTRYTTPFSKTVRLAPGATTATLSGLPVDGSRYTLTLGGPGTPSSLTGQFADSTLEAFPVCDVSWTDDRTAVLPVPSSGDWRYFRVAEVKPDGTTASKTFAYTYSQPAGDKAIRGRTLRSAYTIKLSDPTSRLKIQMEDYRGNTTGTSDVASWTNIPAKGEPCTPENLGADLASHGQTRLRTIDLSHGPGRIAAQVTVKDTFGNPLTGLPVTVTAARSGQRGEATRSWRTSSGHQGATEIALTGLRPGRYNLTATVAGKAVANGSGSVATIGRH